LKLINRLPTPDGVGLPACVMLEINHAVESVTQLQNKNQVDTSSLLLENCTTMESMQLRMAKQKLSKISQHWSWRKCNNLLCNEKPADCILILSVETHGHINMLWAGMNIWKLIGWNI